MKSAASASQSTACDPFGHESKRVRKQVKARRRRPLEATRNLLILYSFFKWSSTPVALAAACHLATKELTAVFILATAGMHVALQFAT